MRVVQIAKGTDDTLEVNWMWLPTFIGQNSVLLKQLGQVINEKYPPPYEATDEKLDEIHIFAINWLQDALDIRGLDDYLMAIEHVGGPQ